MKELKRADIAKKYFEGIETYDHGNQGMIALLNIMQRYIDLNNVEDNKAAMLEMIEDIKSVLFKDDIMKKKILEEFKNLDLQDNLRQDEDTRQDN